MELKRKIYDKLLEWKEKYSKDYALMIEGARRIGKSTIVEIFAKKNYKSYVIIDFAIASDDIKKNFDNLNKLDIFFQNISFTCSRYFQSDWELKSIINVNIKP